MKRFIFLDIDGPLIPSSVYFVKSDASMKRSVMSTVAIGWVNQLCKQTNAKVVFNTTHNIHLVDGRTVKDDVIAAGLNDKYVWDGEVWKTSYPNSPGANRRLTAINQWLGDHGFNRDNSSWVAFDDEPFLSKNDTRLVLIDFDVGIDVVAYNKALSHFGVVEKPFYMLEPE